MQYKGLNLYMFETSGIEYCEGCDIISAKVIAETEDEARNILFEELISEKWLDKTIAQCVEIYSLDRSKIIDYEYDL